ncbi:hypothetical protein CEXT_733381 [Caerostris extrusa]|uniref:Uncharacterized protein n=1 Tax=Caerostris extrusa TaxID=172846 RepID=A0AAV4TAJ5_CAEEX|nr:hypothetical protein CEXT_733381 [Caerostris extrusa]
MEGKRIDLAFSRELLKLSTPSFRTQFRKGALKLTSFYFLLVGLKAMPINYFWRLDISLRSGEERSPERGALKLTSFYFTSWLRAYFWRLDINLRSRRRYRTAAKINESGKASAPKSWSGSCWRRVGSNIKR